MTRAQIIQRASFYFNARVATSLDPARWVEAFNIAYEQMGVEAKCVPFSYTFSLVHAQRLYMVPTYALEIRPGGITHSTQGELRGPVSVDLLEDQDSNWLTNEGTPTAWYIGEQNATLLTETNWSIGIYPVPAAALSNGITMIGYRTPAALTSGTDVPPVPAHLHDAFSWGVCYFAALHEMQGSPQTKAAALAYFEPRYWTAIARLRGGRTGIGAKLWVRGGAAPGHAADDGAPFQVIVT